MCISTHQSSVAESSENEETESISKATRYRTASEQDQNLLVNQIVARFHQDYRRVSSDLESPRRFEI